MFTEASHTDLWNNHTSTYQQGDNYSTQGTHIKKYCLEIQRGGVIYIYSRMEWNTETDSERYGGIIANVAS